MKDNSNNSVEPLAEYIGSRIAYGLSYGKAIIYSVEKSGLFPDIKVSNNCDIDIETGNITPYIDFGASYLAWNRKDWEDICQRKSITSGISKPFAKTHLQQLKVVENFLKRDKQILKIKNPIEVLEDIMEKGNWISNDYPQYYNAVYYSLSRRIKRICSEVDFIKYV